MIVNLDFDPKELRLRATCLGCAQEAAEPIPVPTGFAPMIGMLGAIIERQFEGGKLTFELPGSYLCRNCSGKFQAVQADEQAPLEPFGLTARQTANLQDLISNPGEVNTLGLPTTRLTKGFVAKVTRQTDPPIQLYVSTIFPTEESARARAVVYCNEVYLVTTSQRMLDSGELTITVSRTPHVD